jgi:serine/threonine-protein kinase RsbW
MSGPFGEKEIRVSVPARPEFVHVLRIVACAVAARLDLPYDAVSDIALAVDEAFSHLLSLKESPSNLKLHLMPSRNLLEIYALADVETAKWPMPGAEDSLTWKVLSGLADEAGFVQDGNGAGIRFTKRLQESANPQ